jgi:hypothetical protein
MSGHRDSANASAEQRAAEIRRANGFQLVCELIRPHPRLGDCQRLARVADDVRVGGEVNTAGVRATGPGLAQEVRERSLPLEKSASFRAVRNVPRYRD